MSFDSEVKAYTKIALADANKTVKKVVQDVMVSTVNRTSVDTGKLKNSWYASFGAPIKAVSGRSEDKSGQDSLESAERVQVRSINLQWANLYILLTHCPTLKK
jgi:hypothetical protein